MLLKNGTVKILERTKTQKKVSDQKSSLSSSASSLFTDNLPMVNFLLTKTQFYIDSPYEFNHLIRYITGDHDDFTVLPGEKALPDGHRPLMVMRGRPGAGKTIILAKLALHIRVSF